METPQAVEAMSPERMQELERARIEPIRKEEIAERQMDGIPDDVINVFNKEIVRKYSNGSAKVYQDEVVEQLRELGYGGELFRNKWLDVEPLFRKAGWSVEYDKPVLWAGENYRAHFIFS